MELFVPYFPRLIYSTEFIIGLLSQTSLKCHNISTTARKHSKSFWFSFKRMDDATLSTQHFRKYRNILNKSCMIPKFCRVGKNRICNNNIVGLCTCIQSTSLPRKIWNNNNLHFITICEAAGTTLSILMTTVPLCKHCVCHYTDASCTNHTIVNYVTHLCSWIQAAGIEVLTPLPFWH